MDLKDLSLPEIYKSIGSTLKSLRLDHEKILSTVSDPDKMKDLLESTLKPGCELAGVKQLSCLAQLKGLLADLDALRPKESVENVVDEEQLRPNALPTLPSAKRSARARPRPLSVPPKVCYPPISPSLTRSPRGSHTFRSLNLPKSHAHSNVIGCQGDASDNTTAKLRESLKTCIDELESHRRQLQEMFTTFTQRVLVPLQTFCKYARNRERSKDNEEISKNIVMWEKKLPKDLNQNEFVLIEMLNRIRMLLWPSNENSPKVLFSPGNMIHKCFDTDECEMFPLFGVHPDVLCKFAVALDCATLWLKRDEIYTENAKSGLLRAHRRFIKTQRMWQEARETQRELSEQWNEILCAIETKEIRLETLQNCIDSLHEDLSKLQDGKQTIEIKLVNATEGIDRMRSQHRCLRKRINTSCKRLEAKERSRELVMSRVRSCHADKDAVREKLRIGQEFIASLQEKMIKLYGDREAWRRRYEEKSDPKLLKARLDTVGLRIPAFVVREKTFVLKSKAENLEDAISIVRERLRISDTHWSLLCHHLSWPSHVLSSLQSANPRIRRRALSDRSSSSSSPTNSSSPSGESDDAAPKRKIASPPRSPATERIVTYVKSHCPGTNEQQCAFMLRLWLEKSGSSATLEQLVKALQRVRMCEAFTPTQPDPQD